MENLSKAMIYYYAESCTIRVSSFDGPQTWQEAWDFVWIIGSWMKSRLVDELMEETGYSLRVLLMTCWSRATIELEHEEHVKKVLTRLREARL